MKTFKTNLLGLALAGLILGACSQTGTYETADLMNEQAADKAGAKLTPFGTGNLNAAVLADCNDCITDPQIATAVISKTTGNGTTNYAFYKVYNTATDIVLEFDHYVGTDGADGMSVTIAGTTYAWSKDGAKNPAYTDVTTTANGKIHSFKITQALGNKAACTNYATQVSYSGGAGGSLSQTMDYAIYEYCSDCDDESFTYSVLDEEGVDVTFSYNYSEEAEVTLAFTFPQIISDIPNGGSYTGADGKTYTVTGNGTVFHWTGIVSCSSESPTTFAFEGLVADCGPSTAKDGKANIWTDAKVTAINGVPLVDNLLTPENEGPYSLKGELPNIVYEGCPVKP